MGVGHWGRRWAAIATGVVVSIVVAVSAAPAAAATLAPISISGNQFDAGGVPVRLIGVDRSGSEYSCVPANDAGVFVGPTDQGSVTAMRSWGLNAVQIPLNEACWLGNYQAQASGAYASLDPRYTGTSYQQAVESYVARLNANGIYAILNLSGAAPGNNVFTPAGDDSQEVPLADADHSLDFWTSVATAFKDNPDVLFHAYDEPNTLPGGGHSDTDWACVENGCTVDDVDPTTKADRYGTYTGVGDQALVTAIRDAGATSQPILLSGPDFAGDLSQWATRLPADPSHELGAIVDIFDYTGNFCPGASCFDDQSSLMTTLAASYPVVIGGYGESDCPSAGPFVTNLMNFADAHGISYLAWTWDTETDYGTCNNALLGNDANDYESGAPSAYGALVMAHDQALAGRAPTGGSGSTRTGITNAFTAVGHAMTVAVHAGRTARHHRR